jgi:hypothetical protein
MRSGMGTISKEAAALIEQCASQIGKCLLSALRAGFIKATDLDSEAIEGAISATREMGVDAFEDGTRNAQRCENCACWDGAACSEGLDPTGEWDWCISWCTRD